MDVFDLIVVGGGSAGYAAAKTAATEFGARVAVVDRGPLGGLCILAGCMPSKAYIQSSHVAHLIEKAAEFGLRVDVQPETAAVGPLVDALAEHAARLRAEGALPPPRKKSRRR
jgi:pyruvate/2-oxoglutarate dehydrogenase complex dihydrolipoamide dehydrogenase (E3) component